MMIDIFGRKRKAQERHDKIHALRQKYDKDERDVLKTMEALNGKVFDHPKYGRIAMISTGTSFTGPDRTKLYCEKCKKETTFSHLTWKYYYCEKCCDFARSG